MRSLLNFRRSFLYAPDDNGAAVVDNPEAGRLAEFQAEASTGERDAPVEVVTSDADFARAEAAFDSADDPESDIETADDDDEAEAPNPDAVDDGIADLATHYGLTTEQAKAFPGGRGALVAAMKLAASQRKDAAQGRSNGEDQQPKVPKFEWKPFDYGFKDDDDVDPKIREKLVAAEKHHQEQMQSLMQHVAVTSDQLAKVVERDRVSGFDQALSSLDERFRPYIGEGSSYDLDQNGDAAATRTAIAQAYIALLGGRGSEWKIDRTLVKQATMAVLGERLLNETGKAVEKKTREQMAAEVRSGTARPTHVKPAKKPADYLNRARNNMGKLISAFTNAT